jgi:hypothetical protein
MRAGHAHVKRLACYARMPYRSCMATTGKPRVSADVRAYFARISRLGGQARARNLSPAERSESAKKAAAARWSKRKRA